MFTAILDSCVLWPSLQRDFVLSMAIEGLYRPLWSERILDEVERNECRKLIEREQASPEEAELRAHRLVESMRGAFDDALVADWEPLEGTYNLPDPNDEHVVAAAVMGGAGVIVTNNLKDFPREKLPSHLDVLTACEFAQNTADVDPTRAARAITKIATRHMSPPHTPQEILQLLVDRYKMYDLPELLDGLI